MLKVVEAPEMGSRLVNVKTSGRQSDAPIYCFARLVAFFGFKITTLSIQRKSWAVSDRLIEYNSRDRNLVGFAPDLMVAGSGLNCNRGSLL
jgi:hypothetical protein